MPGEGSKEAGVCTLRVNQLRLHHQPTPQHAANANTRCFNLVRRDVTTLTLLSGLSTLFTLTWHGEEGGLPKRLEHQRVLHLKLPQQLHTWGCGGCGRYGRGHGKCGVWGEG